MALERLRLERLRCIDTADLELHPRVNFLFGANGAGKTTVLEAVYLIGRGRSFRTRVSRRLVQRGAASGLAVGDVATARGRHRVGVELSRSGRDIRLDGKPVRRASELAEWLPVHVIDPGLHALIDGGPSVRRRFVDWGVFHVEHAYLAKWRHYRRVLGQRNAAVKSDAGAKIVDVWTEQLASLGEEVTAMRERYVEQLALRAAPIAGRLLGEPVTIDYRRGWPGRQGLGEALELERRGGLTEVGPHRADLEIGLREGAVRNEASRGQQKLVAASLILAQVELAAASLDSPGILLVDEPAAELDAAGVARLRAELERMTAQTILTGLAAELLPPVAGARVFHVEQGRVNPVYNAAV
jgi:DNA replication and repair protein RecF